MRRVFFSFDWDDVWRVMQVRKSNVVQNSGVFEARFADAAEVEEVKKKTKAEIKKWIDEQMQGASVTCVLIGEDTSNSYWVAYEIKQSIKLRKGLLGVYIHNVKDQNRNKGIKGKAPFRHATYDWVGDNGRENLPRWIEDAAKQAGRRPSRRFPKWVKRAGVLAAAGGIAFLLIRFLR